MVAANPRFFQYPNFRLAIFAKAPVLGRVKTRLAKNIGHLAALRWHKKMLFHSLEISAASHLAPVNLWCTPSISHTFFKSCKHRFPLTLRLQPNGTLGARMQWAAQAALKQARGVVLLGSDCPVMDSAYIRQALWHLQRGADVVIGPAEDGGYVLLGLRQVRSALFRELPWGSDQVLAITRQRLKRLGVSWVELPILWDVDQVEDLYRAMASATKHKLFRDRFC